MKMKLLFILFVCNSAVFAADYTVQTLEKAHGIFRAATNDAMYAAAAQQYEFLVNEEGIRNGDLFYTLGNSWFLAGDVGRAILNYRRAERYFPGNADVRHNLETVLEKRIDLIPAKGLHPLASRFLGWHFNTSTTIRWWLFSACWVMAWGAWTWKKRTERKEARITTRIAGILSFLLIASLITELVLNRSVEPGVILASEVLARKGDGEIYAPAFLDPLHSGTEFFRLEDRGSWWHIRLADGQECWIPSRAAEIIAL
jgi:hypothetical protein